MRLDSFVSDARSKNTFVLGFFSRELTTPAQNQTFIIPKSARLGLYLLHFLRPVIPIPAVTSTKRYCGSDYASLWVKRRQRTSLPSLERAAFALLRILKGERNGKKSGVILDFVSDCHFLAMNLLQRIHNKHTTAFREDSSSSPSYPSSSVASA